MNDHYGNLPRYLSLESVLPPPNALEFDSNWSLERLRKVAFFHGTKKLNFLIGSQEIPCCNVSCIKLGRGSPINFDN
jgi:hypothetical protein